ncbi:hypothetical protein RM549_06250 [Salegentibacter sp. F188]|uniref:Uncharacterized protein n=1 Tax=Autumnicola patrickiae TaxID=3075591 RepID=A0ABU3E053_9FLAO|nr:hypothetical protein [Salegentibacter sp. F188]MDT0689379.1 hypothetical protein [Salegentibacter sp. F188]
MVLLFQSASDAVQLLSIKEVSGFGLLIAFGAYQVWQNKILKDDLKDKDAKIDAIVKEHLQDLREGTRDAVTMATKYETLVAQVSALNTHRHGSRHN